jgi:hypothetical protein
MTDNLPSLKDFSKESINKAVVREALTYPLTMFPGVLAVLCGLAGTLFASPALLVAAGGCALTGAGCAVVNYCFRYEAVGRDYLESLSRSMLQEKENLINSLKPDLLSCDSIDQNRCRQGLDQFTLAKEKYAEVKEILAKKLSEGELMYGRFLGSVEQVYFGMLDNLREIVNILQGLPDPLQGFPLDSDVSEERLQEALNLATTEAAKRQVVAILKRFELREKQLQKVDDYLATNEEAITALEATIVAVSSMKTGTRLSDGDHEEAIEQLKSIAQRVYTTYDNKSDSLKV